MLLPLACLIIALEGIGWRLFDAQGVYTPALHHQESRAFWLYILTWSAFLSSLGLGIRWIGRDPSRGHPAVKGLLHVISCAAYLFLLPWGQWLPDILWFYGCTWRFAWEMTTLFPYLMGELLILGGFGSGIRRLSWLYGARHLGFMLLPYVMGQVLFEGARLAVGDALERPYMSFPVSMGLMTLIVGLMPTAARWMIPSRPMDIGPLRDMLSSQMTEAGLSFKNILEWNAGPTQANAAVLGMLPTSRYLLVTRPLTRVFTPEELRLVVWHELGHVAHHHLWIYYLFFMTTGGATVLALEAFAPRPTWISSLGTVGVWVALFSLLSRNLERQADLFAKSHETSPGDYGRVLLKLSSISGIPERFRSLTHGSIRSRVEAVERMGSSGEKAFRFHRHIRRAVLLCLTTLAMECAWWIIVHAHELMGSSAS